MSLFEMRMTIIILGMDNGLFALESADESNSL